MKYMSPERIHIPEFAVHNPRLIYSCHIDFVHPHTRWKIKDRTVTGVLDDQGPAAVLFTNLPSLKGEVHFTENEETSMDDARKLAKNIIKRYPPPEKTHPYWHDRSWLPTVCVLDVTDQGAETDITFENFVFFDPQKLRDMMDKPELADITYEMVASGGWDETFPMAENYIPAFSLCLPVTGNMHTFNSGTTFERISKYERVLNAVDQTFS